MYKNITLYRSPEPHLLWALEDKHKMAAAGSSVSTFVVSEVHCSHIFSSSRHPPAVVGKHTCTPPIIANMEQPPSAVTCLTSSSVAVAVTAPSPPPLQATSSNPKPNLPMSTNEHLIDLTTEAVVSPPDPTSTINPPQTPSFGRTAFAQTLVNAPSLSSVGGGSTSTSCGPGAGMIVASDKHFVHNRDKTITFAVKTLSPPSPPPKTSPSTAIAVKHISKLLVGAATTKGNQRTAALTDAKTTSSSLPPPPPLGLIKQPPPLHVHFQHQLHHHHNHPAVGQTPDNHMDIDDTHKKRRCADRYDSSESSDRWVFDCCCGCSLIQRITSLRRNDLIIRFYLVLLSFTLFEIVIIV